jgi:chemotaxis protein CheD
MKEKGAIKKNISAYLVGGACMFGFNDGTGITTIGDRNVGAAREILESLKIPVVFEETGGNAGRTITFNGETGKVSVKTLQKITMRKDN